MAKRKDGEKRRKKNKPKVAGGRKDGRPSRDSQTGGSTGGKTRTRGMKCPVCDQTNSTKQGKYWHCACGNNFTTKQSQAAN